MNLTLTPFSKSGKEIYLTNLAMSASTNQNFQSNDRTLTWDLGEFAKIMNSE